MRITTSTGAQKDKDFVSLKSFYLGSPYDILLKVKLPCLDRSTFSACLQADPMICYFLLHFLITHQQISTFQRKLTCN